MSEDEKKKNSEQPIIIKKINKGGHGAHGGAWKVAYADFVTAMMAFFIVMWILAAGEDVKNEVSAYFNDPGLFKFVDGKQAIPVDLGLKPVPGKKSGDSRGEGQGETPDEKMAILNQQQQKEMIEQIKQEAVRDSVKAAQKLQQTAKTLEDMIKALGDQSKEMKDLMSAIKLELTEEGLRIELSETKKDLFFKPGSSEMLPQAKKVLFTLAKEIGKLPNLLEIEGHTDSKSYGRRGGYSNWELSADRANSTRRTLDYSGLWNGQIIKVTGFSDKKLLIKNNPFDDRNRRVSLLVKQMSTGDILKDQIPDAKDSEE